MSRQPSADSLPRRPCLCRASVPALALGAARDRPTRKIARRFGGSKISWTDVLASHSDPFRLRLPSRLLLPSHALSLPPHTRAGVDGNWLNSDRRACREMASNGEAAAQTIASKRTSSTSSGGSSSSNEAEACDSIEPAAKRVRTDVAPVVEPSSPPVSPSSLSAHRLASYPTVSFHCLERARKTIEDFVRSYLFIFHTPTTTTPDDDRPHIDNGDHDSPSAPSSSTACAVPLSTHPSPGALQLMFQLLPLLTYVAGTIYQLDEENEEWNAERRRRAATSAAPGADEVTEEEASRGASSSSPAFTVLLEVLRQQQLLTARVHTELQKGQVYWQLEREICEQLSASSASSAASSADADTDADADAGAADGHRVHSPPPGLRLVDVHAASRSKSFDYRVLHLLVYAWRGLPPDEEVLAALLWNEQLVDLHDDLVDYEDDVASNSFNVYRCYVRLYGARDAPLRMAARIRTLEEGFTRAARSMPSHQRALFALREAEAMREYGHPGQDASRWVLPPPILDERAWIRACDEAERKSCRMEEIASASETRPDGAER